ncbi:PIR Superfamily Protein [Plasmodium ovale curtisi]|uniref:PIR Superfamily Protein n=1 Tax=Plasmodium ovale curtisi TaxID=864141 RepID=A0A1A8XCJ1_PLAOA|nr:PIR Superfamily Protein [Plasmodium ovale curtisi]SBT02029.1 PIR Superfamily Protein [Plasmodium ovale curtisi]
MYDFYVDYQALYGTACGFPPKCAKYYKKIEDKTSLYKYFEEQCLTQNDNCPDFYEQCKPYKPENVLFKLTCHADMEKKKAREKPSATHHPPGKAKNLGHSVLGVTPVLLAATALYRYIPIGAWIFKLGGANPNNISNMDGFSPYTQESGDIFRGN